MKRKGLFSRERTNRGLFFRRMLVWYTVTTSVIYLLFGVVMSASVQRDYRERITQLNERAIAQSVNTCTATLQNLYNYYYLNVLDGAELTEILLANQYSQKLSIQFKSLNSLLTTYSNLVDSCYVINLQGGFVCSTADTCRSLESFPDQDILEQLEMLQDIPRDYVLLPRKVEYAAMGKTYEQNYISLIFKKYREGYLVINLNHDLFTGMVNHRDYDSDSRTILVNDLGMVLADSTDALFARDISGEQFMAEMREQEAQSGQFNVSLSDGDKKVYYSKDQLFGISYLILETNPLIGRNQLLLRLIIYSLLAMAVNLGLIVLGTNVLYGPISRLQKILGVEGTMDGGEDEFKAMERVIGAMRSRSEENSRTARRQILRELLEDKGNAVSMAGGEYQKLCEDLNGTFFICVLLYPDAEETENDEMYVSLLNMEKLLRERLDPSVRLECVDYRRRLVCLFNFDEANEGQEDNMEGLLKSRAAAMIREALKSLQDDIFDSVQIDLSCSIGSIVGTLDDISESYKAALTAAFFQVKKEKKAILRYSELAAAHSEEGELPAEIYRELLNAVKNGDKGKVRAELSEVFSRVSRLPYDQAVRSLQRLELEIVQLELKNEVSGENEKELLVEGRTGMQLYRLQEAFLARCFDAAEQCREKKENNPNMLLIVEQVKALVEDNLTRKDLSVTFIAQKMYLSTNYVRSIFKEVTGEPLSSYIITQKLVRICGILKETDWSGQQIADYMGFSTKSYFYTFFKNYMGVTPSQYRKDHAGREKEEDTAGND